MSIEQKQKIRIALKALDHKLIDLSTKEIVETAKRTGASIAAASGPRPTLSRRCAAEK